MRACWAQNLSERPSFQEIRDRIGEIQGRDTLEGEDSTFIEGEDITFVKGEDRITFEKSVSDSEPETGLCISNVTIDSDYEMTSNIPGEYHTMSQSHRPIAFLSLDLHLMIEYE